MAFFLEDVVQNSLVNAVHITCKYCIFSLFTTISPRAMVGNCWV